MIIGLADDERGHATITCTLEYIAKYIQELSDFLPSY